MSVTPSHPAVVNDAEAPAPPRAAAPAPDSWAPTGWVIEPMREREVDPHDTLIDPLEPHHLRVVAPRIDTQPGELSEGVFLRSRIDGSIAPESVVWRTIPPTPGRRNRAHVSFAVGFGLLAFVPLAMFVGMTVATVVGIALAAAASGLMSIKQFTIEGRFLLDTLTVDYAARRIERRTRDGKSEVVNTSELVGIRVLLAHRAGLFHANDPPGRETARVQVQRLGNEPLDIAQSRAALSESWPAALAIGAAIARRMGVPLRVGRAGLTHVNDAPGPMPLWFMILLPLWLLTRFLPALELMIALGLAVVVLLRLTRHVRKTTGTTDVGITQDPVVYRYDRLGAPAGRSAEATR